jgi:hypothetical protein
VSSPKFVVILVVVAAAHLAHLDVVLVSSKVSLNNIAPLPSLADLVSASHFSPHLLLPLLHRQICAVPLLSAPPLPQICSTPLLSTPLLSTPLPPQIRSAPNPCWWYSYTTASPSTGCFGLFQLLNVSRCTGMFGPQLRLWSLVVVPISSSSPGKRRIRSCRTHQCAFVFSSAFHFTRPEMICPGG